MASDTSRLVVVFAGALALAATLVGPSAKAEAEPTQETREATRTRMAEGRRLRAAGDHRGAAAQFGAAYALMKIPTTGLEYGRSLVDAGQLVEGVKVLGEAATLPVKSGEPAPFAPARAEAGALAAKTERLTPTVRLSVRGAVASKVTLDDRDVGAATVGASWPIDPGRHVLRVEAPGQAPRSLSFDATLGGGERALVVVFEPGEERGATSTSPLVWVGFGVAGAGAVVGITTGVLTWSKRSSLDDACPDKRCPPSAYSTLDDAHRLGTVSNVAFGVAGAGVVLGVVGLLTPRTAASDAGAPSAVRVQPWIGVGSAGLAGTF